MRLLKKKTEQLGIIKNLDDLLEKEEELLKKNGSGAENNNLSKLINPHLLHIIDEKNKLPTEIFLELFDKPKEKFKKIEVQNIGKKFVNEKLI